MPIPEAMFTEKTEPLSGWISIPFTKSTESFPEDIFGVSKTGAIPFETKFITKGFPSTSFISMPVTVTL